MTLVRAFQVNEIYTNDQIRFALGLENLGGIRPSVDARKHLRHLAIMTVAEESARSLAENPYHDRIEGDVLIYTAQGREGDQEISGRNKRLLEQYSVPTPFFGFINLGQQTYRFLGLLELLRHYQEIQTDKRKTLRKVWVFEFRIHKQPDVIPVDQASTISAGLLSESRRNNLFADQERQVATLASESESGNRAAVLKIEDLRSHLLQIPAYRFEHLIKALLDVSGFSNTSVTSASGDGGIDINAYVDDTNDFFAGTHVQAQVKRWRHAVGSVEINHFRGALSTTAKGVFITTSYYTRAAIMEAAHSSKPCITLIDGGKLSSIIIRTKLDVHNFV